MASTNLFKQLYSHDNSTIQSGFTCLNARNESETSFDISNNNGVITDSNGNTLASIPLNKIHSEDLSQYNVETRILLPHSCYVLLGQEFGLALTSYYFHIPEEITEVSGYESYIGIECDLIYNQYEHKHIHISVYPNDANITDAINNCFDENDINITATILNIKDKECNTTHEYIVFLSQTEGYFFFIKNILLVPILQSKENPDSPFSTEVEDIKYLIYTYIKEFHPILPELEYDEDTYEISCNLYNWVLENYKQAIKYLYKFEDAIGQLKLAEELMNSQDIDDLYSIDLQITNLYNKANKLIKNTVYDMPLISLYDTDNLEAISNIITALSHDVESAYNRYTLKYWLHEHYKMRIPTMKYPNGAFRGIVIIPDYPDDELYELSTLYVNHILHIINVAVPDHDHCHLYRKEKFGVIANALFKQEIHNKHNIKFQSNTQLKTDILDGWDNAENEPFNEDDYTASSNTHFNWHLYTGHHCNNPAHNKVFDQEDSCGEAHLEHDIVYMGESCYSDKTKMIGLYKYLEYVNENNLWTRIGDAYMAIGKDDNHQNFVYNLLPSVMIYNPNDIPIRIQYLIFS